jgi:hypothetical protein
VKELFLDSIRTHPYVDIRIKNLSKWVNKEGVLNFIDQRSIDNAMLLAEFESVEGAFENNRFDKCLFQALQLKSISRNDYVTTMIGRMLLSLNIQRIKPKQYLFVANSSRLYKYDLRAVINFLNNVDLSDLGELTFRFINLKGNFNPANEEHYFILWKICDITDRNQTMNKVKTLYEQRFPQGEYVDDMKKPEFSGAKIKYKNIR